MHDYDLKLPVDKVLERDAGFWKKLGAFVIDMVFLFFLIYSPLIVFFMPSAEFNNTEQAMSFLESNPGAMRELNAGLLVISVIYYAYFFGMEWYNKATFGEHLLGLKAVSDRNGLSITQLLSRNVVRGLFSTLYFFDLLVVVFRKDNRSFSEIVSGTSTVEAPRLAIIPSN